jgi:hypothetical protein
MCRITVAIGWTVFESEGETIGVREVKGRRVCVREEKGKLGRGCGEREREEEERKRGE